jgi:hypothetical protein
MGLNIHTLNMFYETLDELEINDILNSTFLNTAKELFAPNKIVVKSKV